MSISKKLKKSPNHPSWGGRATNKKLAHFVHPKRIMKRGLRRIDKMSQRKYSTYHPIGTHLTFDMRIVFERAWNEYIRRSAPISLRAFARIHNLPYSTWQREYRRGAISEIIVYKGKYRFSEYSARQAQESINLGKSNKGPRMKMTNLVAADFKHLVLDQKLSPYDARQTLQERHPGEYIPCWRTFYNHIEVGDIGVFYGQTPYHPHRRKRHGQKPHPAKVLPDRRSIDKRPEEANKRLELGHFEMDTVVSKKGAAGGLLVLIDRMSRRCIIERLQHIAQLDVLKALNRMLKRDAIKEIKSITTDNGSEFLSQSDLEKEVKCNLHYTRAYASYEKGSVENCNRIIRRWYPKGTDFRKVSRGDLLLLEQHINQIHRQLLNGQSALTYEMQIASKTKVPQ